MTNDDWKDLVTAVIFWWTVVAIIALPFGFHIGWWDLLTSMGVLPRDWIPADPRYT